MLTITPAAAEALKIAVLEEGEPGDGMRISVYFVGSHPEQQYYITFDKRKVGDHVLAPLAGLEVYVDDESMKKMEGITLDLGPVVGGDEGRLGFRFVRG